jgi:hypothetical protein
VTATEADQEVNETLFHLSLAEILGGTHEPKTLDIDGDGAWSLLDLYLAVCRDVMMRYRANESIPTEHAQLDDNGDGRSSEIQLDYWDADLKLRRSAARGSSIRPEADGALAAGILLKGLELPRSGSGNPDRFETQPQGDRDGRTGEDP